MVRKNKNAKEKAHHKSDYMQLHVMYRFTVG